MQVNLLSLIQHKQTSIWRGDHTHTRSSKPNNASYTSHFISKMYFSLWKTPGVSERMWSVNLEGSISGEYQTLGGYSGRPSE